MTYKTTFQIDSNFAYGLLNDMTLRVFNAEGDYLRTVTPQSCEWQTVIAQAQEAGVQIF